MTTFIECPGEGCTQPAEVVDIVILESTEGDVRHLRTLCVSGHPFCLPEIR